MYVCAHATALGMCNTVSPAGPALDKSRILIGRPRVAADLAPAEWKRKPIIPAIDSVAQPARVSTVRMAG